MVGRLPQIDYTSHPAYGGMLAPSPALGDEAVEVLRPLIREMAGNESQRAAQFGYQRGYTDEIGRELAHQGYSRIQLGPSAIDSVCEAAQPVIERVRERLIQTRAAGQPIKYKTALETIDSGGFPDMWRAVEVAIRDAGFHAVTAAFFGAPSAKLHSVGVLVNHPDQDWANRIYRDLDIDTPPTAGFHIDSNGKCLLKAVLYLTDVGPEQGPFGMVPGSHLWGEGSQERIYRRAFDRSELIVRSAKKRRMFLSLPTEMQVKAEFGGDMIAGSPEAEELLGQEIVATGPRGQLNLFDPEAIHRGGNVRRGERIAVLITTRPVW